MDFDIKMEKRIEKGSRHCESTGASAIPMRINREFFVKKGREGGKKTGPTKRRGPSEYYKKLVQIREAKKAAEREKLALDNARE